MSPEPELATGASKPTGAAVGAVVTQLVASWAAVVGVVGAVEESWLWPVLTGLPVAYVLWVVGRMLRVRPAATAR